MPNPGLTEGQMREALALVAKHKSVSAAARAAGLSRETFRSRVMRAQLAGVEVDQADPAGNETAVVVHAPAPADMAAEDLVEQRIVAFRRKREHEESRKLIRVECKELLPLGILHVGDPHCDDDGTDIELLRTHSDLTRKYEGLYAANVGDTTNNWIGRLARLYAEQSTSASQAWVLAEWLIKRTNWLYLCGGNHDAWSGSGDPLRWVCRQVGALYQDSEVRIGLEFPNGNQVRINCRHDFAGSSIWNPAHGVGKALQLGVRDHIAICGHKHTSGYMILKDPHSGAVMHGIQVGSYKTYDRYAREHGFRDQMISPAVVTVIDPRLPETHPGMIKVFWDAAEGAEYLQWARAQAKRGKAVR